MNRFRCWYQSSPSSSDSRSRFTHNYSLKTIQYSKVSNPSGSSRERRPRGRHCHRLPAPQSMPTLQDSRKGQTSWPSHRASPNRQRTCWTKGTNDLVSFRLKLLVMRNCLDILIAPETEKNRTSVPLVVIWFKTPRRPPLHSELEPNAKYWTSQRCIKQKTIAIVINRKMPVAAYQRYLRIELQTKTSKQLIGEF